MIPISLSTLADVLNTEQPSTEMMISSISTDTRNIHDGALFVALKGERFDAHDFADKAVNAGASALVVEKKLPLDVPQLIVTDTRLALGAIGAWIFAQQQLKTVAITGSCGKTTVKEMVATILGQKANVLFTQGNFNNDIGVPLTLLSVTKEHQCAVIELGANHIGEIAYTTRLVKPDVALVNNVAEAHLEGFGSIEGVKQAKGEIFQGLPVKGTAVVNLDSWGEELWQPVLADKTVVTFSLNDTNADLYADNIELDDQVLPSFDVIYRGERYPMSLPVSGRHNVSNALAATAICLAFGCCMEDIKQGLQQIHAVKGRVAISSLNQNIKLIDDSYNASVPAMKAAVDLLASMSGTRWLILGNMAELGDESLALHRQVGEYAAPYHFDYVLTFGDDAQVISDVNHGKHFATHQDMIAYIEQHIDNNKQQQVLLVKGANSSGMFNIATALKEKFA
jgi:UDP-N-acetylmuramoyl-tripeptide--D-alanyl-D-alanine ligase